MAILLLQRHFPNERFGIRDTSFHRIWRDTDADRNGKVRGATPPPVLQWRWRSLDPCWWLVLF